MPDKIIIEHIPSGFLCQVNRLQRNGENSKMRGSIIHVYCCYVAPAVRCCGARYPDRCTQQNQIHYPKIATIGIMAALSFVAYEFFRIPNVLGTGSSFHLGNTFTALTALMLDGVSGGLAGAIGLALADIMAGDPGYAITTFILKFIIGIVCGVFAHKVFKLQDLSAADGIKYYVAVIGSAFSGLLVNVFTDPFLGYFRNRYIFGQEADLASTVAKITSGVTLINSLLSTVCAVVLFLALVPALRKANLLPAADKPE